MKPEIKGRVTSGLGEGAYYVKEYSGRILEELGFEPFPGTLNVIPDSEVPFMGEYVECSIGKFEKDGEEFGAVEFVPCEILYNEEIERCYIVIPEKTEHINEIEVLSRFNLKEKLGLGDGDRVGIRII